MKERAPLQRRRLAGPRRRGAERISIERASAETHLYKRGASFRIPGEEVDGMDVLAVKAAATAGAAQ